MSRPKIRRELPGRRPLGKPGNECLILRVRWRVSCASDAVVATGRKGDPIGVGRGGHCSGSWAHGDDQSALWNSRRMLLHAGPNLEGADRVDGIVTVSIVVSCCSGTVAGTPRLRWPHTGG